MKFYFRHSMKDKDYQRKSDKERRKNERKQESKAAKTLSAILFAFIITWTPYNGYFLLVYTFNFIVNQAIFCIIISKD